MIDFAVELSDASFGVEAFVFVYLYIHTYISAASALFFATRDILTSKVRSENRHRIFATDSIL